MSWQQALFRAVLVVHISCWVACEEEEEEGLQGVFKRLRHNGHQLEKGCCEQLSSDCHSKGG
jgi:hypothetical protein